MNVELLIMHVQETLSIIPDPLLDNKLHSYVSNYTLRTKRCGYVVNNLKPKQWSTSSYDFVLLKDE